MMMDAAGDRIDSSSTSAGVVVELQLTIHSLPMDAVTGSSIELYLEDDFRVPDRIDRNAIFFAASNPVTSDTNNGGQVAAAGTIEIEDGDHFGGDDDWSIRVFIPDMDSSTSGYQGPVAGQTVNLVFTQAAGIKNPSEEGSHSVGYSVLGPNDAPNSGPQIYNHRDTNAHLVQLKTYAKISLSDDANKRGYQLTIIGSGFNNGTAAGAYVLHIDGDGSNRYLWDALRCSEKEMAVSGAQGNFCQQYHGLGAVEKMVVDSLDFSRGDAEASLCYTIINNGALIGGAEVGSDDKFAITAEVTVPTFQTGDQNYICAVDGEGRASKTDVKQFHLEAAIRVVPSAATVGDTVTVYAQDFPVVNAAFNGIWVGGQPVAPETYSSIGGDHSATATFVVPGGLSGTYRVDARWGDVRKSTRITVYGSRLVLSSTAVAPNETIVVWGDRFGNGSVCLVHATMSGVPLLLLSYDDVPERIQGYDCIYVEVNSNGQFVATFAAWPADYFSDNPALTPGTHLIEVGDNEGFTGSATIVIKEPTLLVDPAVADPGENVTISGESWPVVNENGGLVDEIAVAISDGPRFTGLYPNTDSKGRWSVNYRVPDDVIVPSTFSVSASYGSNEITKRASIWIPNGKIKVIPRKAFPGERITLTASGMPLFYEVNSIEIGHVDVLARKSFNSDRNGNVMADGILVPGLPPGPYRVRMEVGGQVAFGILEILSESSSPTSGTSTVQDGRSVDVVLSRPTNLTATAGGQSGTVDLRWNAPANAQYHFVTWLRQGITDLNQADIMPVSGEGRATISALSPGTTYNFTVIAGRWEWSPNFGAKWSAWADWVASTAAP